MAKTFFYERKDGTVFACEEKEASLINSTYKLLGTSDGVTFYEGFKKIFSELQNKITELLKKRDSTTMSLEVFDNLKKEINDDYKKKYDELFNQELEIAKKNPAKPRNMARDFSNIPSHLLSKSRLLR